MKPLKTLGFAAAIMLAAVLVWQLLKDDAKVAPPPSLNARAVGAEKKLREHTTQAEAKLALEDLKRALRQMDTKTAREWILQQLLKTDDVATHLNLSIGPDQNLQSWPSYRVFLLDMMFLIDPAFSAQMTRDVIGDTELTMDEFAILLRNLARAGKAPTDTEVIKKGIARMLGSEEWLNYPTTTFLEGFDVIVHTKEVSLVPQLLRLSERQLPQLGQAAFLTLDRLVMAQAPGVLPLLDQHAATHPASRPMISNMFARADVRDAAQRQAVENYLLSERRTPEEIRSFASTFPNTSQAASNNLITRQKDIPVEELMKIDRAALDAVVAWLADARFAPAHPALREAYQRLSSFVKP